MPPVGRQRRFEVIQTALTMAEERGRVRLDDVAAAVGVDGAKVVEILEPLLYLEFRTRHDFVSAVHDYEIDWDTDELAARRPWLRDLRSRPPDHDVALRLLVAARAYRGLTGADDAALNEAIARLEEVVGAPVRLAQAVPEHLEVVRRAVAERRRVRIRYTADDQQTTEREVDPWQVTSRWGHWLLQCHDHLRDAERWFRVDRIVEAMLLADTFDPPAELEVPDLFDLEERRCSVRVRLEAERIHDLPQPLERVDEVDLGDGRVEVTIEVNGQHRLDQVLLAAGPTTQVLDDEVRNRRSELAKRLLAHHEVG